MKNRRTLVLNSDYQPISVFPLHHIAAQDAITRVLNGTCHVVEEYDEYIKTPNAKIKWPAVIARKDYLRRERIAVLNKTSLLFRDGKKCAYCSKFLTPAEATIDHVIPKHKGGQHKWENVVIACGPCNHTKTNKLPVGIWKPKIKPYKPTYHQMITIRRKYPIEIRHKSWEFFLGNWNAEIILKK